MMLKREIQSIGVSTTKNLPTKKISSRKFITLKMEDSVTIEWSINNSPSLLEMKSGLTLLFSKFTLANTQKLNSVKLLNSFQWLTMIASNPWSHLETKPVTKLSTSESPITLEKLITNNVANQDSKELKELKHTVTKKDHGTPLPETTASSVDHSTSITLMKTKAEVVGNSPIISKDQF